MSLELLPGFKHTVLLRSYTYTTYAWQFTWYWSWSTIWNEQELLNLCGVQLVFWLNPGRNWHNGWVEGKIEEHAAWKIRCAEWGWRVRRLCALRWARVEGKVLQREVWGKDGGRNWRDTKRCGEAPFLYNNIPLLLLFFCFRMRLRFVLWSCMHLLVSTESSQKFTTWMEHASAKQSSGAFQQQ